MRSDFAILALALCGPAGAADFQFAALSLTPTPWDKAANYAKFERFAREAKTKGAAVIVAPESFLDGYVGNEKRTPGLEPARYREVAEPLDGPYLEKVRRLAIELRVHLMIGFAELRRVSVFNSVAMFSPEGKLVVHYSKTHTMNDEPFNVKGEDFSVADTSFGKVGTLICFDRQLPETARILALRGARLLLVPAWGSASEMNDQMMRVRAYENGVWLAFVHPERALIIDPRGKIVAANTAKGDQIVMGRIQWSAAAPPGLLQYRRPHLYSEIAAPVGTGK